MAGFPMALVLAALLIIGEVTAATAAPRLKIEPKQADLGEIQQGDKIEQIFQIKNTGDAPLKIEQVKTSCGCTVAMPSQSLLSPGERGELKAVFNSSGFSGNISKIVYVYTNDPTSKVTEVVMKGRVIPEITVTPEMIDLGSIKPDNTRQIEVAITNNGKIPVIITDIEPMIRDVEIVFKKQTIAPGKTIQFTVKATPPRDSTRMSGYLIVHTDRVGNPPIRVPFFAAVEE